MSENAESIVKEVKEVQGAVESILRDTLGDYREREAAREKRDKRKDFIIIILILAMVGSFIYYHWSFKDFVSKYDFITEIAVDSKDGGNANYIGNDGDITNGVSESNKADAP